jgi:hypothetical protein
MFRALTCPSSGGPIVFSQHLVSSLSVNGRTVHWLRALIYYDARSKKDQRTRAIYRPTHQLSTINQHPFIHRVSFVYLRQCTSYNLSCKVSFFLYVMDGGIEQRVAITFCFKAGLSATETLVLVQKGLGMRL